jgi:hypothetical protein
MIADERPVEYFREVLNALSRDRYPRGVVPLPGMIDGTVFFSAGPGLYCEARPSEVGLPRFPFGGTMIVGNNLGAGFGRTVALRHRFGSSDDGVVLRWSCGGAGAPCRATKISQVGQKTAAGLACPKCGGTQFKATRKTSTKLALGMASMLGQARWVTCVTCGTRYQRG